MTAPVVTQPHASTPSGTSISMTAPVETRVEKNSSSQVVMSFTLPASRFKDINSVPKPLDERIILQSEPPTSFIVVQFTGCTTASVVRTKITALRTYLSVLLCQASSTCSSLTGTRLWRYNPPWCVPFLRKNELAIPLSDVQRLSLEQLNVQKN
jgi:SOUL heme-binding protein